jgi:hypothetical protein
VEALTTSGAARTASLRSSNPKDRADTLETLEQGCDRTLFRLLVPLVDERRTVRRTRLAAALFPAEGLSEETVAMGSLNSRVPLECASALLALFEADPAQALDICRLVLRENPGRFVRRNVLQFLDKRTDPAVLTDIEKVGLCFASPFFSGFSVLEMCGAAAAAEEIVAPAGTPLHRHGDPEEARYILTRGEAVVEAEGRQETLREGGVFGEWCVLGEPSPGCTAVSRGARVLRLPKRTLLAAAQTYPRVAMELLSRKLRRDGHAG